MPIRIRPRPRNNEWPINDDPKKLDAALVRFLGDNGDKLLSEETKWLAVTHKSFDQGRRGFNDRLSYLGMSFSFPLHKELRKKKMGYTNHHGGTGKRIVEVQLSTALVSMPRNPTQVEGADEYGRVPFDHPALDGLLNLSELTKSEILDKARLFHIARSHNLEAVIRWKPRRVRLQNPPLLFQGAN
jgi:large subunit ribosomal protein L15